MSLPVKPLSAKRAARLSGRLFGTVEFVPERAQRRALRAWVDARYPMPAYRARLDPRAAQRWAEAQIRRHEEYMAILRVALQGLPAALSLRLWNPKAGDPPTEAELEHMARAFMATQGAAA